jgi:hypothetical protein
MTYNFDLSSTIRESMVKEITSAQASGNFFFSKKFNSEGDTQAPEILLDAATAYDEHWMAYEIENRNLMKTFDKREGSLGEYATTMIPDAASAAYAESQFNRFYMIAVCNAASSQGKTVTIFKAQSSAPVKSETTKLIGKVLDPEVLKTQLRSVKSSFTHELLAPHSGLSIKLT